MKILLYTALADGGGDLRHCIDIYLALKNIPRFRNDELSLLVTFPQSTLEEAPTYRDALNRRLSFLNCKTYYCLSDEELKKSIKGDIRLQSEFNSCDQVLMVSHGDLVDIQKYFKPTALIKLLGEHERVDKFSQGSNPGQCFNAPMGLGPTSIGIKLTDTRPLPIEQALTHMQNEDKSFLDLLLRATQSADPNELITHNLFIVGYYSQLSGLKRLIHILGINDQLPKNKDILLYLSTTEESLLDELMALLPKLLQATDFKSVEIYLKDNNVPMVIPGNLKGNKDLRVISNYWLKASTYEQLLHCAYLHGVSGDNSLEQAISFQKLPYYYSTHYQDKMATVAALERIISNGNFDIESKLVDDFKAFFEIEKGERVTHTEQGIIKEDVFYFDPPFNPEKFERFRHLDLPAMIKAWEKIASFIKKNFNYYDYLEAIVDAKTPADVAKLQLKFRHPNIYKEWPTLEEKSVEATNDNTWTGYFTSWLPFLSSRKLQTEEKVISTDHHKNDQNKK